MKANLQNTLVVPDRTKVFPYYDDFDEDKNFKRIVFRPGYSVQARELTQISTILQNQIERFGQHIFVNGSSVIGGEVRYLDTYTLNLESRYANTDIDVSSFVNKTIIHNSGNTTVMARVISATSATDTDPPSLYIGKNYITGAEFGPGSTITTLEDNTIQANLVSTSNVNTKGMLAFIDDSIFFHNGFFVKTPKQVIVASKYTTAANAKIGLEMDDDIITEESDPSLLDPALEASNYQAPGAVRYKLDLILARRDLDSIDDEGFIEISRIENGVLQKNITTPIYSEIEEVFARRTYDESGNYTVNPFRIQLRNSTTDNANNFQLVISEGKGYILGYEFQTIAPQSIESPRARTVANVTNYNLNMNYGNYVIVDKLQGEIDTSSQGLIDIHCVPYNNVNTATANAYVSTKIGSARVKDVTFYSGDSNTALRSYELYLFDTRFNALGGLAAGAATNEFQIRLNTANTSATDNNAYVGATIEIVGGTSSGDVRTINAYNSVTRTANVSRNFTANTDGTSQYRIKFDFGDTESFVLSQTYTTGSSNANCNITVLNKDNGLVNGRSFISEASSSTLVFPLPENFIKAGTMADREFTYRRVYTGVQFTSGVTGAGAVQATLGEDFVGATSTSNTSSTVMENFLVVISNPQSSGRPKGDQVKVKTTVSGSPEQVVFDSSNTSDTFIATVYAKMQITDDSLAQPRVKTLVKANTLTFTSEAATGVFINSTGSNTSVYVNTGQVMIKNPSRTYDERESLYLSDVTSINKIWDLGGATVPAASDDLTVYTDVTTNYIFDTGQKEAYYDHASIRLRPGATPARGPLVVCCRYYKTTSDKGYFSVDSYPSLGTDITEEGVNIGTGYAIIPTFEDKSLRDCIDFRPVRTNASNTSPAFTLGGVKVPVSTTDFTSTYDYYLGRRDLVALTGNRNIELIQGTPSKYPQNPQTPTRAMVLYSLSVPPYTAFPSNVSVEYVENKRYTMNDIGDIDERVSNLEYYVSLNHLEKSALDMDVRDVDGLTRAKYGIFADTFVGHGFGDSELFDYSIAIDLEGRFSGDGMASNEYLTKAKYLTPISTQSSSVAFGSNKITLAYTVEEAIQQPTATKFTPVSDLLYASFDGNIITLPEADIWKDTKKVDVVNIINTVVEVNLRRFIQGWPRDPTRELEKKQRASGMSEVDIINAWAARVGPAGITRSTQAALQYGVKPKAGEVLLTQDSLKRLGNIFG